MDMEEQTFLDECWTLYFHDPDNSDWGENSYKSINTISTIEDWIDTDIAFTDLWTKGMFFLMREHIQPRWEDPENRKGGCFSFKVNKPDVQIFWFTMCSRFLGNTLGKNEDVNTKICGVSISPKRNYCIMRIWIGSHEFNKIDNYNINIPEYTQVMYKEHEENTDFNS